MTCYTYIPKSVLNDELRYRIDVCLECDRSQKSFLDPNFMTSIVMAEVKSLGCQKIPVFSGRYVAQLPHILRENRISNFFGCLSEIMGYDVPEILVVCKQRGKILSLDYPCLLRPSVNLEIFIQGFVLNSILYVFMKSDFEGVPGFSIIFAVPTKVQSRCISNNDSVFGIENDIEFDFDSLVVDFYVISGRHIVNVTKRKCSFH